MTKQTIINTINSVCNTNPYLAKSHEVFLAALHCFYFMKPSETRDSFVDELEFLFVDTLEDAKAVKRRTNASMRDSMIYAATKRLLIQLTENFDEAYFKSQIKNLDLKAEYGRELVSKCIRTFNKEQLLNYFELVGGQNFNGGHFISDEAFLDMWYALNDECCKIDASLLSMRYAVIEDEDVDENEDPTVSFNKSYVDENGVRQFNHINTLYFFDYLPTDTIVRVFEKYVDGDMEMLAFLTAAFCSTDYKTAMCLTFAMCHYLSNYSVYSLDTKKSIRILISVIAILTFVLRWQKLAERIKSK